MSVATEEKVLTLPEIRKPLQAIRAKCLECSCGSSYEVRNCVIPDCALYPYRLGHNPNRAGIGGNGRALQEYQRKRKTKDLNKTVL